MRPEWKLLTSGHCDKWFRGLSFKVCWLRRGDLKIKARGIEEALEVGWRGGRGLSGSWGGRYLYSEGQSAGGRWRSRASRQARQSAPAGPTARLISRDCAERP